ncbi:UNVERIFIED_CONTAM: hypothetical protein Sradi_3629500 [Sesamum radiatum]|uniref:Reverse transcriptase zinc-binding domain-containing protein n=1 Tax=Sesamum radiatum TaxID=300843 RepID=A0AAW2QHL2_SESRA
MFPKKKGFGVWNLTDMSLVESPNGTFTMKGTWNTLRAVRVRRPIFKDLWHSTIIKLLFVFMWRLLHDFIPMDDRLRKKGLPTISICLSCCNYESLPHLFLNSLYVREVWIFFGDLFGLTQPHTDHITTMLHFLKCSSHFSTRGHVGLLIPMLILWLTWKARNNAKFNDVHFLARQIIKSVLAYLWRLYRARAMTIQN